MTLLDHQELQISRDSSNLSLEDWERLACLVGQISGCACDRRFDPAVKVVYANPFLTEADYLSQFAACTGGVLLAGYGAGNANTLLASGRSALPAIRQACQQGKLVALSSQVPLESYDLDYQVGRELVLAGGLPCGELTLADAQVKLSYLLGHRAEIEAAALAAGLQPRQALVTAFLAGLRLRKKSSQAWLVNALSIPGSPVRLAAADPFVGRPFADGLNQVIQLLQ